MLTAVSCSESIDTNRKASIVLAEDQKIELDVQAIGEVLNIKFNSSLDWTAQADEEADWISIIPASGSGGDVTCKVKAEANRTGLTRSAIITIASHESNRKFKLNQNAIATGNGGYEDDGGEDDGEDDGEDNGEDNGEETPGGTVTPGQSGEYGWYELPKFAYTKNGSYMIDQNDSDLYYDHHLCDGPEKGPGGKKARNYTVCFSAEHHCPVWVAAPRHSMYEGSAKRTDAYTQDPKIPNDIQYIRKDADSGCNNGHMLGSAERTSSTNTNKQVFYFSNIAPQYSDTFNTGGGGWNILEDWVDGQVCSDTLYVVIGAHFDKYTDRRGNTGSPAKISFGGRNDVSRPTMFYYILMRTKSGSSGKALKDCSASEIKCAAFVRSHKTPKGTSVSEKDLMSVSDLEEITGFTYFPNVPHAPKDSFKASDWGL